MHFKICQRFHTTTGTYQVSYLLGTYWTVKVTSYHHLLQKVVKYGMRYSSTRLYGEMIKHGENNNFGFTQKTHEVHKCLNKGENISVN